MTRDSLEDAGFSKGEKVHALVKAINVMLVKHLVLFKPKADSDLSASFLYPLSVIKEFH